MKKNIWIEIQKDSCKKKRGNVEKSKNQAKPNNFACSQCEDLYFWSNNY